MKKRNSNNNTGGLAAQASSAGRTVNGQWLDAPVSVQRALHAALDHLIGGLHDEWTEDRDHATTDNLQHLQFRARTVADVVAVLMSEMEAHGAGLPGAAVQP